MKPLTAQQMASMLNVRGWTLVRQRGSHMVFKKFEVDKVVVVPDHRGRKEKPSADTSPNAHG